MKKNTYPKQAKYKLHYQRGYQVDYISEDDEEIGLREVVELLNKKEEIINLLSDLILSSILENNSEEYISKSDILKFFEYHKRKRYYVAEYSTRAEAERKYAIQCFMKHFLTELNIENDFIPQSRKNRKGIKQEESK